MIGIDRFGKSKSALLTIKILEKIRHHLTVCNGTGQIHLTAGYLNAKAHFITRIDPQSLSWLEGFYRLIVKSVFKMVKIIE